MNICICIYVCICIYICTYMYVYVYICIYIYIYMVLSALHFQTNTANFLVLTFGLYIYMYIFTNKEYHGGYSVGMKI